MDALSSPWTGSWIRIEGSPADRQELVLTIASRRDCSPQRADEELAQIGERFDVDAAYLEIQDSAADD